jgi:hypothetical protein
MSDYADVYEIHGLADDPIALARVGRRERWGFSGDGQTSGGYASATIGRREGGGRFVLHAYRRKATALQCVYIASCESVDGEYAQCEHGPYNLPGQPACVRVDRGAGGLSDAVARMGTERDRREAVRAGYRRMLADALASFAPPADPGRGRGIVVCGGGRYFASAYVTLRVLRHVGCTLPVQVWHLPGEITDEQRAVLAAHGAECVQGSAAGGWQLKSQAVEECPFAEVLYLDADSYPAQDPSALFDHPAYTDRGAAFWPDSEMMQSRVTPDTWEAVGLPFRDDFCCETGQLLIDKRRHWREVKLARWIDEHSDYYYTLWYGDTGTWPFAWRLCGTPYASPPRRWDWSVHSMLQYDLDGAARLFVHRSRDKFCLEPGKMSDRRFINGQVADHNVFNPALPHEEFCFACLEELHQLLSGLPPDGAGRFAAECGGRRCAVLTVRPPRHVDPVFVTPAAEPGESWRPVGGRVLLSPPAPGASVALARQPDGTWVGHGGDGLVMLIPLP